MSKAIRDPEVRRLLWEVHCLRAIAIRPDVIRRRLEDWHAGLDTAGASLSIA